MTVTFPTLYYSFSCVVSMESKACDPIVNYVEADLQIELLCTFMRTFKYDGKFGFAICTVAVYFGEIKGHIQN